MIYSKGISWIDDCRIPFVDDSDNNTTRKRYDTNIYINHNSKLGVGSMDDSAKQGRFTPNLLVSDDALNDGSINGVNKNYIHSGGSIEQKIYGNGKGIPLKANRNIISDKGSNSRYYDIDLWFNKLIYSL